MRVPLILSLPGRIPEGRAVSRVVSLTDVAGTILDAMGWRRPMGMKDANLLADSHANLPCYGESEFLFNSHGWAPPVQPHDATMEIHPVPRARTV